MTEALTSAIRDIVQSVPQGCVFDSHFVIAMLHKDHPAVYSQYVDRFDEANLCSAHGLIAQQIYNANCERSVIAGVERQSFSMNVHNAPSLCACWFRQ